jgi:hypothetical protein
VVATYARAEAVDVRISARPADGRSAESLAEEAEAAVTALLGRFVWARGATTWAGAIGKALEVRGWTLASTERGTAGALVALLRGLPSLVLAEVDNGRSAVVDASTVAADAGRVRDTTGADVGFAIATIDRDVDTRVLVAVATPSGTLSDERLAFQRGTQGADRAAIAAAAVLLASLRE